jgi:uncharacterized protein with HEPN domain
LANKTLAEYTGDKALQAMVERKLYVVGEAVSQLKNGFPDVAGRLPSVREIVGFRNLLAHSYFSVDSRRVYDTATSSFPELLASVEKIIEEFPA